VRAKALSVIIPGRNEEFMRHTVEDVLAHSGPETEVICVADAYWPNPGLVDHPRLQMIHFSESVGQRAATNAGAALSRAKYICKLDAHCSVSEDFDVKMLAKMEPDMTMIPSMHRLQAFQWVCDDCGERQDQGSQPKDCPECKGTSLSKLVVWQPRFQHEATTTWRFDHELHFQYDRKYKKTARYKEQEPTGIVETPTCIGACFLMERERFWELGGMDDAGHGSWGQYGVELALKAWLSGGRMVTNLDAWFAHMFRTSNFSRNGESSWPYPQSQSAIDKARKASRDLWVNNAWPQQKRPFSWVLEHFPGMWDEAAIKKQKERERDQPAIRT
jgi:hypothetical protein